MNTIDKLAHKLNEDNFIIFNNFSAEKKMAIQRLIDFESSGHFYSRAQFVNDLIFFDYNTNKIVSDLINLILLNNSDVDNNSSNMVTASQIGVLPSQIECDFLNKNGYFTTAQTLSSTLLNKIINEINNFTFTSRGILKKTCKGNELFKLAANSQLKHHDGDTYWLLDQNEIVNNKIFFDLALDPFFISTARNFLGVEPIHVQTNLWFSFKTNINSNNLSTNAQLFHQDKEFCKFLKVFIYINDVDDNNGPHFYVEGSHIDDAISKGMEFDKRYPDEEVLNKYGINRMKKLIGPGGTITFGDTSCLHKGAIIKSGYRIMLQFEYSSSLYLSPVDRFKITESSIVDSHDFNSRIFSNYDLDYSYKYLSRHKKNNLLDYIRYIKNALQGKLRTSP